MDGAGVPEQLLWAGEWVAIPSACDLGSTPVVLAGGGARDIQECL